MITAEHIHVFPRLLDLAYPSIERGKGVRLYLGLGTGTL